MRTDAVIDKKQVRCPNCRSFGYGKLTAQAGDLIQFTEGDKLVTGRMIGRISYAPALGETPAIRGYILAVCIDSRLSHTFERWVAPADVVYIEGDKEQQENKRRVMDYFLSDALVREPLEEVRYSASEGWSTLHAYRAWKQKRDAEHAEWLGRQISRYRLPD